MLKLTRKSFFIKPPLISNAFNLMRKTFEVRKGVFHVSKALEQLSLMCLCCKTFFFFFSHSKALTVPFKR